MRDHVAARQALRSRALGLVIATTGLITLEATAKGYKRTTGSFLDDGFVPGMEITPAGFAQNPVDVIDAVTATAITTRKAHGAASAAANRSLTVGLPSVCVWEDTSELDNIGNPTNRIVGLHYLTEEFVPGGGGMVTSPQQEGMEEEALLYVLTWYGVAGYAGGALRTCVDALKERYAIGTTLAVDDDRIYCGRLAGGSSSKPRTGRITPVDGGWAALQLQVDCVARSRNTVHT